MASDCESVEEVDFAREGDDTSEVTTDSALIDYFTADGYRIPPCRDPVDRNFPEQGDYLNDTMDPMDREIPIGCSEPGQEYSDDEDMWTPSHKRIAGDDDVCLPGKRQRTRKSISLVDLNRKRCYDDEGEVQCPRLWTRLFDSESKGSSICDELPPEIGRPVSSLQAARSCQAFIRELSELPATATVKEISLAFRKASLLCHPDKGGSNADFQCVKWHYDVRMAMNKKIPKEDVKDKPDGCPDLPFELDSNYNLIEKPTFGFGSDGFADWYAGFAAGNAAASADDLDTEEEEFDEEEVEEEELPHEDLLVPNDSIPFQSDSLRCYISRPGKKFRVSCEFEDSLRDFKNNVCRQNELRSELERAKAYQMSMAIREEREARKQELLDSGGLCYEETRTDAGVDGDCGADQGDVKDPDQEEGENDILSYTDPEDDSGDCLIGLDASYDSDDGGESVDEGEFVIIQNKEQEENNNFDEEEMEEGEDEEEVEEERPSTPKEELPQCEFDEVTYQDDFVTVAEDTLVTVLRDEVGDDETFVTADETEVVGDDETFVTCNQRETDGNVYVTVSDDSVSVISNPTYVHVNDDRNIDDKARDFLDAIELPPKGDENECMEKCKKFQEYMRQQGCPGMVQCRRKPKEKEVNKEEGGGKKCYAKAEARCG